MSRNEPRKPRDPGEEFMPCPRGCGTEVRFKNAGNPHTATFRDDQGKIQYYTCKD